MRSAGVNTIAVRAVIFAVCCVGTAFGGPQHEGHWLPDRPQVRGSVAALIQHDYRVVTQEDGSAEYYLLRNVAVVFGNETLDVLAEDKNTRQRRVLSYSSNEYRSYVLLDEPMQYYQSS